MQNEIISAIGTLGFPIVACIYMAWLHHTSEEARIETEQRHSNERTALTEAITKMNTTLEFILDYIRGDEK